MKLFFSPGTCSLHPLITLYETGVPFEAVRVDLRAHRTKEGADYYAINPKGYVPALQLDDGSMLTEGAVIDQYVADLKPEANAIPPAGTFERYRVLEWLNFIASELHKSFAPLHGPAPDEVKEAARARIGKRFDYVAKELEVHPYLVGNAFTVADAYLFNVLTWTTHTGIALGKWPALQGFFLRMMERPAVQAALATQKG
jgi:glutathione S-transferase